MEVLEHQSALDKAKIQLMSRPNTVFFTTILFSLAHIWDELISTACTNGKYIRYNPAFFMSLDAEERLFLLLHEVMHVALMHMLRLQERSGERWNRAADYVINAYLISQGFKMPSMGLYDPRFIGMSTEEVYAILEDEDDKNEGKGWDDLVEPDGDPGIAESEMQDILVRAAVQAKMSENDIGHLPGEIQVYLENLLNPKLPWTTILRRYLKNRSKSDYSYQKPNRRFLPRYYLPSLYSESLMDLAIFVDASGSVSDHDFSQFVSEVASIFRMMKPSKVILGEFDTDIKKISPIKSLQELQRLSFHGRGGTYIEPALQWAIDNKPELMLIFTDGGFNFHEKIIPRGDVIWLIHNNPGFTAPFGKVIHYTI